MSSSILKISYFLLEMFFFFFNLNPLTLQEVSLTLCVFKRKGVGRWFGDNMFVVAGFVVASFVFQ